MFNFLFFFLLSISNREVLDLVREETDKHDQEELSQVRKASNIKETRKQQRKQKQEKKDQHLSQLIEASFGSICNVTNKNSFRLLHIEPKPGNKTSIVKTEEEIFYSLFTHNILQKLTTIINHNMELEKVKGYFSSFPKQFKKKDVTLFIVSEYMYTISKYSSYAEFKNSDTSAKGTLGVTKFYQIRKIFLDLTKTDDVLKIQHMLFNRGKDIWKSRGDQAIDELLSGWASQIYPDNITFIPRKPHNYGLCYYFRANRVIKGKNTIIFCVDMVDSVKIPKTSAIEAAKILLNAITKETSLISPVIAMDSAFYSNDMIKYLTSNGHLFIISGGRNTYQLITAYAKKYLTNNSHIMITDNNNLCYSYTKAIHLNPTTME